MEEDDIIQKHGQLRQNSDRKISSFEQGKYNESPRTTIKRLSKDNKDISKINSIIEHAVNLSIKMTDPNNRESTDSLSSCSDYVIEDTLQQKDTLVEKKIEK